MTNHSKLIGYARVSTKEQDLDVQIVALKKYGVLSEDIYTDKVSGASQRREGFNNCMRALRKGDTLVVHKLDRLGRTVMGIIEITDNLLQRCIDLTIITEPYDTRTPMGKAFMMISAVFAELERSLAIERTKATLARKKERGEPMGRPPKITPEVWDFAVAQRKRNISVPNIFRRAKAELKYKGGQNTFYTYKDALDEGAAYPWAPKVKTENVEPDWAET